IRPGVGQSDPGNRCPSAACGLLSVANNPGGRRSLYPRAVRHHPSPGGAGQLPRPGHQRRRPGRQAHPHGPGGNARRVRRGRVATAPPSREPLLMLKKERAAYILARLAELYPAPPIPLAHKDPYTLLVAVLLSAQCTDERVNKVTPALFRSEEHTSELAKVPEEEI